MMTEQIGPLFNNLIGAGLKHRVCTYMVWSGSLTAYMPFFLVWPWSSTRSSIPMMLKSALGLFPSAQTVPHSRVFFLPPMLACQRIQNIMDVAGTGFRLLPWFLLWCCLSVLGCLSLCHGIWKPLVYPSISIQLWVFLWNKNCLCKRKIRPQYSPREGD